MSPVRLALLVCDKPIPAVVSNHGAYPEIFHEFLTATFPGKPASEPSFVLDCYDVVNEQAYPADDAVYDGILITGSAASAYENVGWIQRLVAYVASVINEKPDVKVIGSCFGHQIVSIAMGAECEPNGGRWEVGVTEVQLTEIGKRLFGQSTINIQQMHRDHVPSLPESFHLLGSTLITPNQGMIRFDPSSSAAMPVSASAPATFRLTDIQVLTVQGHPEYTADIVKLLVQARSATGIIDKATAEDFYKRQDWDDDGRGVIGKVIWGIMGVQIG
ncbi:class I glutamine amidotransferase-like protein [Gloeophyllum trabeum ATCC 11539]|uniref:Class I glutamine amidotransferase-like protein n=1 Tax=Gloeophyllum trabeum (strain ATCC 11539 / FP-39264 / Madison 617) TaxID=670483 RepID=S7PVR8_GLOTA|nr:class I glutamine amidotransferase-like protein [Gloeophyllum trabeum ATCC 11539]EPQ51608.1 class I glutamine amidotransferase-like protein [Gloeophyllum trabeum ATCC 11539]